MSRALYIPLRRYIKCRETQAQLVSLPLLFSSCQVVWRNSREIGAAWAIRKDKRLVISIKYHPGGNYVGYFKNNVFRPIATVLGPEWPYHPPRFTRCPAKFVQQTTTAVPTTTPTSVPNTTQITLPNTTQITVPNTTQITVPTTSPSMCHTLQTTDAPLSQEIIPLKVNRGSSSDKTFFFFILAVAVRKSVSDFEVCFDSLHIEFVKALSRPGSSYLTVEKESF